MAFTDEQKKELTGLIGAALKDALTPEALGAAVKPVVESSLGDITTKLEGVVTAEALDAKLAEITKAAPKPGGTTKEGEEGDDNPVLAKLNELAETVTALKTERDSERGAAQTRDLVAKVLKEKKPNLKIADQLAPRIAARSPKDEAQALAFIDEELKFLEAGGVKIESLSADPGAEGGGKGGDENDESKRIEQIKSAPRAAL